MFSNSQLDSLMKKAMHQLGLGCEEDNNDNNKEKKKNNDKKINLTPSQILVISGLLGGVLSVDSVLVDKNQVIQIVLSGSLKRKTDLEKMMDQIGDKPFDEVLKAMLGRL